MANAAKYIELVNSLNEIALDMIIFPEGTLTSKKATSVEININDNPCDSLDYPQYMKLLSCAAKNATTYLVINIMEKEKCDNKTSNSRNCQNYGYMFYNTNIFFDRKGTIINRYRKYNLFMEIGTDRPPHPEVVIIETDFGVTFGTFTCFDILFRGPSEYLVKKNVDAIIYPTMWHSELPFLTSLQTQQMWSQGHNIKLFAAGGSKPINGSGGTGFYSGYDGSILNDIIASGGSQVYVYKYVPGDSPVDYNPQEPMQIQDPDVLGKQMDSFFLMPDATLSSYNSTVLDTSNGNFSKEFCYTNGTQFHICCDFSIRTTMNQSLISNTSYVYHLVAFAGSRHSYGTIGGLEVCGIIACIDSAFSSCAQRFPDYDAITWPLTFEEITIKARFLKDENRTQFPNSLLSSIRPINSSDTVWEKKEVTADGKVFTERIFAIKKTQNRLLSFAILGRNYAFDYPSSIVYSDSDRGGIGGLHSLKFNNFVLISIAVVSMFMMK